MNISSISSNEVPEVEESLLSSEDIKKHNFWDKSSPSHAGMTVWQPDPFLLFSRPHFFPWRLADPLAKHRAAPAEGIQPHSREQEAALNCGGSKYYYWGGMMWKSHFLLSPALAAHRRQTLLRSARWVVAESLSRRASPGSQKWTLWFHILLLQHGFELWSCPKAWAWDYTLRGKLLLASIVSHILWLLLYLNYVDLDLTAKSGHQKPIWQLSVRTIHVSEHRPSDNLIYLDVQVFCWINTE